MVYKGIFCRTNYYLTLKFYDNLSDLSNLFGNHLVTKCQLFVSSAKRQKFKSPPPPHQNVISVNFESLSKRWSSAHKLLILLFVIFLCKLSIVSCSPVLLNASSSLHPNHNTNYHNHQPASRSVFQVPPNVPQRNNFRTNRNTYPSPANIEPTNYDQTVPNDLILAGFKLEGSSVDSSDTDWAGYTIGANSKVQIHIFGSGFANDSLLIAFSTSSPQKSLPCIAQPKSTFTAEVLNQFTALATIQLNSNQDNLPYYLCYSLDGSHINFTYAGSDEWFQIISKPSFLPIWAHICLLLLLLCMSGLFSGLNLGLMALDKNELQVIERCGTEQEKVFARAISPVRQRGNYLLCTVLLGNVLVNSTLTILLDSLTSGLFAVVLSTLSIVIFGEIIPQAICSRHGLAIGARTIYITYAFMIITFPLSYPISKILDKILGDEIGKVYDRERLMEYINVTKDYNRLEADEMNIISGALKFKNIHVVDVMTPIDDVFMLPYDSILNFDTMTMINNSGYSRIPVYENERDKIVGLLHVKDLSLIDPDHSLPLRAILDFYSHPLFYVYQDVTLDVMLNEFKKGNSHMALVRRVIDNGITDPFYELLGVVTLEDIIEELIQAEINDETDVISDNRRKQKRKEVQSRSNYLDFIRIGYKAEVDDIENSEHLFISPQLALATFRFLASSVIPFRPEYISEEVLKVLMSRNIYCEAKGELRKPNIQDMSTENVLYVRGQPADYFIMILEGRARIIVTNENQEYDAGPFCCFGISALINLSGGLPGSINNLDTKPGSRRSHSQSQIDENEASPILASTPVNTTELTGSTLTINQTKMTDSVFVPDFTLICVEKTIYMKVTRKLYTTAIQTTVIEKHRTGSINKSLSGAVGELIETDTKISDVGRERKVSIAPHIDNAKFRKISMSTNLPDISLLSQNDFSKTCKPEESELPQLLAKSNLSPESTRKNLTLADSLSLAGKFARPPTYSDCSGDSCLIGLNNNNKTMDSINLGGNNGSLKSIENKSIDETSHLI